jgi:hypothetical protein
MYAEKQALDRYRSRAPFATDCEPPAVALLLARETVASNVPQT